MNRQLLIRILLGLMALALVRLVIEVVRVPANLRITSEEWNAAAAMDDQADRPSAT